MIGDFDEEDTYGKIDCFPRHELDTLKEWMGLCVKFETIRYNNLSDSDPNKQTYKKNLSYNINSVDSLYNKINDELKNDDYIINYYFNIQITTNNNTDPPKITINGYFITRYGSIYTTYLYHHNGEDNKVYLSNVLLYEKMTEEYIDIIKNINTSHIYISHLWNCLSKLNASEKMRYEGYDLDTDELKNKYGNNFFMNNIKPPVEIFQIYTKRYWKEIYYSLMM